MKKSLLILFVFLLSLSIVNATEITETKVLSLDEQINFYGRIIKLNDVSPSGSVYLSLDGQSIVIKSYEIKPSYYGIEFEIIEVSSRFAEFNLTTDIPNQCSSNSGCNDYNSCTQDVCTLGDPRVCKFVGIGCEFEGECLANGEIKDGAYCGGDDSWYKLKNQDEACLYNHECKSKYCDDGECSAYLIGSGEEITGKKIISVILGVLIILRGILFSTKESMRKVMRWVLDWSDQTYHVVGALTLALGILLLILKINLIVSLVGILVMAKGLFIMLPRYAKNWSKQVMSWPDKNFIIIGILLSIIGLILIII